MINGICKLIGNTPLVKIHNPFASSGSKVNIYAKLEMFNPTGSIKDRIAIYMVEEVEKRKELMPYSTIIEASSGNMGASLALVAKAKGYRCIITTTEKTSKEKISIIQALGAEVKICPCSAKEGNADHYIALAKKLHEDIAGSFFVDQYNNQDNVLAHYKTTGPEIWEQTKGNIDYLVCCSSSGGTITGTARFLKEKNPHLKVIMPDPVGSVYYSYYKTGKINYKDKKYYKTEGVGKDFIVKCIDFSVIDEVVKFTDEMAYNGCRSLALTTGILAGGSSGAAYAVALNLVRQLADEGKNIVIVFPDSGMKYLSKIYC